MENQTTNEVTTSKKVKQISRAELTALVDMGRKKEYISSHYGLNNAQTTKLLKDAGLKIRKFGSPVFTLID